EGNSLSEFRTNLSSQFSFLETNGVYSPLLNAPVQMNLAATIRQPPDDKFDIPAFKLQINGSEAEFKAEGRLTKDHLLVLTQPSKARYLLTPEAFQKLNTLLGTNFAELQS